MVSLKSLKQRVGTWRDARVALYSAAAAVVTLAASSTEALAQAADIDPTCASQRPERPLQMATLQLVKIKPGAGPMGGSKSAAILGGAPSMLEKMRAAQATGEVQVSLMANATHIAAPENNGYANCAQATVEVAAPFATKPSFAVPDNAILGTMSVSIKHTPFDSDWAAVNSKQASHKMQRTLAATGARKSGDQMAQVEAVNRWVNRTIEFGEDRDVYGRSLRNSATTSHPCACFR